MHQWLEITDVLRLHKKCAYVLKFYLSLKWQKTDCYNDIWASSTFFASFFLIFQSTLSWLIQQLILLPVVHTIKEWLTKLKTNSRDINYKHKSWFLVLNIWSFLTNCCLTSCIIDIYCILPLKCSQANAFDYFLWISIDIYRK